MFKWFRNAGLIIGIIVAGFVFFFINPFQIGDFERSGGGPLGLKLGLDLQGGSYLIYQASIENPSADQMQGAINIIERRVNSYGVSEPVVQQFGENRIILQLPGVENIQEAKDLIGATALLEYKERECLDLVNDPGCLLSFIDKEIGLTGEYMTSAFVDNIPATGEAIVSVIFNSDGATLLSELTKNIAKDDSKRIAIFLDDLLIMAAQAQEVILGGRGYISGGFTFDSARTLAIQLESGRLPIPLELIQESDIDAALGSDSLRSSLYAGIIGLALVLVFMILYYRMVGVLAAVSLLIYAVLTLAIFKLIPIVINLSGIAGFVLSIGMAVDANILIFERIKEELRIGRSLSSAIDVGFNRAWTSIRDSNVSTFIICLILYWFGSRMGTTIVMGFSLTLFIGVAVSMFTALWVTRNTLQIVVLSFIGRYRALFTPESLPKVDSNIGGGE